MLTTEDADPNYDVHPNRQFIGFADIPVTCSAGTTVVGETPNRISGHGRTSPRFKNLTPCRHHTGCLNPSVGYKLSGRHRSRVRFGSCHFKEVGPSQERTSRKNGLPGDDVNIFIVGAIRDVSGVFDHARQAECDISPP